MPVEGLRGVASAACADRVARAGRSQGRARRSEPRPRRSVPAPGSVKAIRWPFGLNGILLEPLVLVMAPAWVIPTRKGASRLAGPSHLGGSAPSARTRKNPFCSGERVGGSAIENSSFTSNTTPDPSGLTPRRCSGNRSTDAAPTRIWPSTRQNPVRSGVGWEGPHSKTEIGSWSPRRMCNACRLTPKPAASTRHSLMT
jgi:hypothetical protein